MHYGISEDLRIYHLLVNTNDPEEEPRDYKLMAPSEARELNEKYIEVLSPLRWVRDPAGP